MTIIEKIKAEIERLYNGEAPKHDQQCNFDDGYFTGIDAIAQFIDALESGKPMNPDRPDEEIQRFLSNATKMDKGEWKGKYPISEMGFGVVARHFYDLGCRRTAEKYDEIEYNRQRAEEQGSEELSDEISHISERYPEVSFAKLSRIAVHFAKWKEAQVQETIELAEEHAYLAGSVNEREKMMKEAVEGEVCIPNVWVEHKEGKELVVRAEISKELGFKFGDKVRIIIVKED